MRKNRLRAIAVSLLPIGLIVVTTACGSNTASDTSSAAAAATVTSLADGTDTTAPATVEKVNANTANVDEIAAALTAAGVDNADRWAREVEEYRPYDTSDPDLTHLRDELAKYNPGEGVVDAIVSALQP